MPQYKDGLLCLHRPTKVNSRDYSPHSAHLPLLKLKQVGVINPCCEGLELFFLLSCNLCPEATVFLAVVINYRVTYLTSAVNYVGKFKNLILLKKRVKNLLPLCRKSVLCSV